MEVAYPPVSALLYLPGCPGDPDRGRPPAWSLIYLFLNGSKPFAAPRHPVAVGLTLATVGSAGLYGSEYFFLSGNDGDNPSVDA